MNGIYSNYGILLKSVQDYDKYYDFSSKEGSSSPYLDIWYDLPDLVPNYPQYWNSYFVISRFKGKRNFDTEYYVGVPLYISWSIMNSGGCDVTKSFDVVLYVDGIEKKRWTFSGLASGGIITIEDYQISGVSTEGGHTFTLVIDDGNNINESLVNCKKIIQKRI